MSITEMKQALETLEENHHLIEEHEHPDYLARYNRRISALRTAIEQAEKQEPVAWGFFFEDGEASNEMFDTREAAEKWLASEDCLWAGSIRPLYTIPPAAPVQEPKQSEIFCGVDFADGVLSVSVLRRRPDDVAELLHSEQIELQPPAAPVQDGNAFFKQFQTGLMDVQPAAPVQKGD